jgi:hypothetical protein
MPRVASNHKQKNKKFKGTSKSARRVQPQEKKKTKGIAKVKTAQKLTKNQRIKHRKEQKDR